MKDKLKAILLVVAEVFACCSGGAIATAAIVPCENCTVQPAPASSPASVGPADAGEPEVTAHG